MDIPDPWKEEYLLHSWKMSRIEKCNLIIQAGFYGFSNGIIIKRGTGIYANLEQARAVESALKDWIFKKNTKKETVVFGFLYKQKGEWITKGEYWDLLWKLYSI